MKKILLFLSIAALSLVFLSCGGSSSNPAANDADCDTSIVFEDSALEGLIRKALGKVSGSICYSEAEKVTSLVLFDAYHTVKKLGGIEYFTNLEVFSISQARIGILTPLAGLKNLREVTINSNTAIQSLLPLAGLTKLTKLDVGQNVIVDLTPLSGLTNLEYLNLNTNKVVNLAPLSTLTKLKELYLAINFITDITPLASLGALTILNINSNQIASIAPLAGLLNLEEVDFYSNLVSDISPLGGLPNLNVATMPKNQVSSPAPLNANPAIAAGDKVCFCTTEIIQGKMTATGANQLVFTAANPDIIAMRARGVMVWAFEKDSAGKTQCIAR